MSATIIITINFSSVQSNVRSYRCNYCFYESLIIMSLSNSHLFLYWRGPKSVAKTDGGLGANQINIHLIPGSATASESCPDKYFVVVAG